MANTCNQYINQANFGKVRRHSCISIIIPLLHNNRYSIVFYKNFDSSYPKFVYDNKVWIRYINIFFVEDRMMT